jgi:hypothetical protein
MSCELKTNSFLGDCLAEAGFALFDAASQAYSGEAVGAIHAKVLKVAEQLEEVGRTVAAQELRKAVADY